MIIHLVQVNNFFDFLNISNGKLLPNDHYSHYLFIFSPQYLRKQFFPRQKLLEYAGLLNPLDAPHHLRVNEYWFYREGVTLPLRPAEGKGSWVDVGLYETKIQIDKRLQQGLRVTVQRTDITQEAYFRSKELMSKFLF